MNRFQLATACTAAVLSIPLWLLADERVDLSAIHRIKAEAFENSKVMDTMFYLTDVYGPRLANSPNYRAAADWAAKQMKDWGLTNVKQEKFPFGRSWAYSKFSAAMVQPQYQPLIGFPLAWTPGTNGVVTGEPVLAVLATDADLEKWKGKLKGKIVMTMAPKPIEMVTTPLGKRYTDSELTELERAPEPGASPFGIGRPTAGQPGPGGRPNFEQVRKFRTKVTQFLKDEEVLAVLQYGYTGDGGTVFGAQGGSREMKDPIPPPMVVVTPEHYNRIARLLDHKIPVKLEFDIKAELIDEPKDCVNIIGEIEGGRKKDEIVMIGGHFDSWQGGTGATDNGAGSAVMMEAMRILKTLNVKMDRTVRIGLWGGEEEGLIGSKEYVKEHFGDPETMKITSEHAKLSAYFNVDNGTGKIRGIYLQGNDMAKPIFQSWLAPFKDLGATAVTIRNTGGTDHQSFDAVGLPGFQFIQDPMDYMTRTHHSNMDVYDRISKGDLMQMSAIVASFVYDAANRDEMIPRKTLPAARPRRTDPDADEKKGDKKTAPATAGSGDSR